MIIVNSIFDIPETPLPLGITFGNFDGVHLGHQHLIRKLRHFVGASGTVAVLTFLNHPSTVINNFLPSSLCSFEKKIDKLRDAGVDLLILLSFTKELSELSYKEFILQIRQHYPFTHLLLGQGAKFGKERGGDETQVKQFGLEIGFKAHYEKKLNDGGEPISSGRIRDLIKQGNIEEANRLLG
jgi:riboflavin kinase / FMN adenylyltransferase